MGIASDAENQLDRTDSWIREKIGIPEEQGFLEQLSIGNSLSTATGKEEVIAWFWLQLRAK